MQSETSLGCCCPTSTFNPDAQPPMEHHVMFTQTQFFNSAHGDYEKSDRTCYVIADTPWALELGL